MGIPSPRRAFGLAVAAAAAGGGALAAFQFHRLGLTLSHYDARGHLVVARRIIDSLTPGWQQIGAVWLPLPHLLNAVPVQVDVLYRSGASAVAISIASFAVTTAAIALIVRAVTNSAVPAVAGAAVFALNPNVLYLQATPMTEPLLLGLMTAAIAMLIRWCDVQGGGPERTALHIRRDVQNGGASACTTRTVGCTLALACLTRYEAWPVTALALAIAAWARWRMRDRWDHALRSVSRVAVYPLLAVLGFVVFSRVVVGQWFVTSGFFVPENPALGHPLIALRQIAWGIRELSGYWSLAVATLGLVALIAMGLADRRRAATVIALTLLGTAALPWFGFVVGHPFRIRYMVPLLAAQAIGAGVAAGLVRRARMVAAAALLMIAVFELGPLNTGAPTVREARWDWPNEAARRQVTAYLSAEYAGETVMASMGSLGHYMQELSHGGLGIRDFLHEGNGDIWLAALEGPRPYAGWILIEEIAEDGDMLAKIARQNPRFLRGFSRVCAAAGVALYRRDERPRNTTITAEHAENAEEKNK